MKKSYLCMQFNEYGESKYCHLCVVKRHELRESDTLLQGF